MILLTFYGHSFGGTPELRGGTVKISFSSAEQDCPEGKASRGFPLSAGILSSTLNAILRVSHTSSGPIAMRRFGTTKVMGLSMQPGGQQRVSVRLLF
jgi:hypothetical protein